MYKVLIVDDEEIVRTGIKDLIEWEKENFTICAEGKDGKDGLMKLSEYEPDLILVDIKMPGLGGIELIKAAREQHFNGHFIILTGYSEFEFAKSAISLGVKEYLLKPIDEDELLNIVIKIRDELDLRIKKEVYHTNNEDIAKEELLRKIIQGYEDEGSLEEQLALYKMKFVSELLCTAIITEKELIDSSENNLAYIGEFFGNIGNNIDIISLERYTVIVAQGITYKQLAELLQKRNESFYRKYNRKLLIAVGHNVSRWYDLSHSYEFANFLLEHEFLFGQYQVLTLDVIVEERNLAENPSADYICMLIEVGDQKGIEDCILKFKTYCTRKLLKEMDIKLQIMYNLLHIKNWLDKKHGGKKSIEIANVIEKINWAEALDGLLDLYHNIIFDICKEIGCNSSETVIKRMYYYMEQNYEKDLKLETVAKMFNYNSNYLGKVFRKEIGESFNNILDTIRIVNAKRLLKESDLKVYQISQQVGYSNIDYFYLKFKKYVGISPKEFRKNYLEE